MRYSGKPKKGIRIAADQVYTFFQTDQWLVSQDDPADKASFTLSLTLPEGLDSLGNGRRIERTPLVDGRVRHVWREDLPQSSYLFGFAAGRFQQASRQQGKVFLLLMSPGLSPAELERIFIGTGGMLEFFEKKAGVPYPGASYAQVLMPDAPPQEASGYALMSEEYGRSVLEDPREDNLIAHELSHQWWGNLVTCSSWSDFWLNEGIATFMAAAFKESFWGHEEYERDIVLARLRYERALAQGARRPLVFTGWSKPGEMGGSLTYSRGALVLHFLRHELGDAAFWNGLREFTRAGAGKSVDTKDFRAAMERASGRNLEWIFAQWADSAAPEDLVARHRQEPGAVVVEIEQRQSRPWRVPLTVVVETETERVSRRVVLREARETLRFAASGALLSVRIDGEGTLPRFVRHERPLAMLLHQARFEPDQAGRVEALTEIERICAGSGKEGCQSAVPALKEAAAEDSSRLVRQVAARTLESTGLAAPDDV